MATTTLILQARDGQRHWLSLARVVGLFFGFRVCIPLLLFRSDPALGTTVTLAASVTLALLSVGHWLALTPVRREHHGPPSPVKWAATYLAIALVSLSWSLTIS